MERGGGASGIGWRGKTRRKGIWEDPGVGFECGGGGGGILGSWSRVCPNRHVGGLYIGKEEEFGPSDRKSMDENKYVRPSNK